MGQIHTPKTGGARVRFFGEKATFPRPGAWVIAKEKLGIIFELTPAKTADGAEVPAAIIHFVKSDGTTEMKLNEETMQVVSGEVIPVSEFRKATYTELHAHPRNAHWSAYDAGVAGYELSTSEISSLTTLQRKRLHLSLNDEDKAQAEIEQIEHDRLSHLRAVVANHPDAIALEEQIEKERVAFITSVESRRQAMFDTLTAPTE